MSGSEPVPETKPKPVAGKPNPTVKSVMTLAGIVVGTAAVVGLFAVGGPLIAAGGVVAAGGAGYVRHRVKNPRRPVGRRKSNGGKLSWPLTGNQKSRALLPRGSSTRSGAGGKGKPTGLRGLKSGSGSRKGTTGKGKTARRGLPLPTTRSRAARSAGGVLPKHKGSRSVPSRTAGKRAPSAGAAKPKGIRAPKTPSRTPSKPGRASRLMGGSPSRKPNGATRSTKRGGRSGMKGGSLSRKSSPTRGRSSTSPRGGSARKGITNPFRKVSPSGKHARARNPFKRTTATPGRRRGLTTSPTKRARRLGTPKAGKTANRSPNRTASRPKPYKRATARKLLRQSIGLPTRGKSGTLQRPTSQQRLKARRTLRLRGLTRVAATRKLPAMAARKWWDTQYGRVPVAPDPQWRVPTVPEPKAKVAAGPRHLSIVPNPSPSPEVNPMSVSESVSDAFSQIAGFEADGASQVEQLILEQPEMFATIGQHYSTLADRMVTEMPFDPAVADAMRDLAAAIAAAGQVASQVHEVMRNVHEEDFARTETPRPNERMWDTDTQG